MTRCPGRLAVRAPGLWYESVELMILLRAMATPNLSFRGRIVAALPSPIARPLTGTYERIRWYSVTRRKRSTFVHGYLHGLKGVEIGAAAHNPFYLDAINVDRYAPDDTVYKQAERRVTGRIAHVDIVASGDDLPFRDDAVDFVFSSHVIEHIPDPIGALYEWVRVAKRYVVVVAPHYDRTFDAGRRLTTVPELLERHETRFTSSADMHWSVWSCESFLEMCVAAGLHVIDFQDPDDKVGNGFTIVLDASSRPSAVADSRSGV